MIFIVILLLAIGYIAGPTWALLALALFWLAGHR